MHAWLLLLAVLATFLMIVQVASTEDNNISVRFITAITPIEQTTWTASAATTTSTVTRKSTTKSNPLSAIKSTTIPIITPTTKTTKTIKTKTITTKTTTALAKIFNPINDLATVAPTTMRKSTIEPTKTTPTTPTTTTITKRTVSTSSSSLSSSKLGNKSSDKSDKSSHTHSVELIESKNIESRESQIHNEVNKVHERTEIVGLADHSELLTSKKHKKVKSNGENKHKKMTVSDSENAISEQERPHYKHHHHQKQQQKEHHQQQQLHNHRDQQQHQPLLTLHPEQQQSQVEPKAQPTSADHYPVESHAHASIASAIEDSEASSTEILASVEVPANAEAVIVEDEPATYSNKEIIKDKVKPDPSTLVEIENSLLSLFNMKRPPKIDRSKIIIPEAMKQLYAQIMGHELDSVNIPKPGLLTKSANTVRSFTHKDSKIDDRFPHHHRFRLHFDVKSIPGEEKLKAAELQLSRDAISHAMLHPRQANRTRYQVLVYDITRIGVRGKREPNYLLLDSKTIRLNGTETVSMDVQPAVDRWLDTPQKNYGLLVEVRTMRSLKPAPHHHVRLRRSADEPHEKWQHKQPLLFTYTDDGRHKSRSIRDVSNRSKRAGSHHRRPIRRKNYDEICRRHSLYVDFADVGWSDWIVAPPGYDAFYCHGKCPFPLSDHLNSTNHAVVQTLVNNLNPGKVPKACCVPTQLEGISMLYLNDQSTVVLKNYQDMTVVGCGCR